MEAASSEQRASWVNTVDNDKKLFKVEKRIDESFAQCISQSVSGSLDREPNLSARDLGARGGDLDCEMQVLGMRFIDQSERGLGT